MAQGLAGQGKEVDDRVTLLIVDVFVKVTDRTRGCSHGEVIAAHRGLHQIAIGFYSSQWIHTGGAEIQ